MASVGFRWLDILEKEFDKAFVDLDLTVGELDSEEPVIVYNVRQKLCTLSSCFAQLTHKAQTIFQNSAKIEAELIHMRAELVDSKAKREILEQELHNLLLQLHTTQLSQIPKANGTFKPDPNFKPDVNSIKKKLENEMKKSPSHIVSVKNSSGGDTSPSSADDVEFNPSLVELKQLRCENYQLQRENVALRNQSLALNSEVYGAKLAAKYLDKELAGRIQQLQLLGREMRGDVRDKLWRQLESEILLQRHKTVVRECRRNSILNGSDKTGGGGKRELAVPTLTEHFGDVRTVIVKRKPSQGLGISITGGREHGVPILISELEPNGPAALSGELYIGDAILSVNEKDLRQACHKDAVDILKQNCEECRLQVQYIAADDSDNSLEEDGFHFRFFDNDVCDPNDGNSLNRNNFNTPTAPRTPESVSYQSGTASRLNDRDADFLTTATDPVKSYQVSPEIQKVIDSLQAKDVYSFSSHLSNLSNMTERNNHPSTPNNNAKDFLTGDDNDVNFHNVNMNINNEINRNADTSITKFPRNDLILLDNRRSIIEEYKTNTAVPAVDNFNCSTNSLNSENLSSPMQTSTDMFIDSEVLSTDMASNDSHSPKTNDANIKFNDGKKFEAIYGSNETFSNTKSDQSLLNSSCESSPVHKSSRDYKKTKKYKSKKYFGVKTLQSIFSKHDGYSDISSNASDCPEDEPPAKEVENLKLELDMEKAAISVAQVENQSESAYPQQEVPATPDAPPPAQAASDTTTYKYRTILTETSPQFEENIHSFLSEIFMKNFQTPDTPETTATTSKMGTKRYLRVGKALRLCSNEDNAAALNDYEQRREKLLARYVYNSNSLSADGEGNPDFGTPV